MKQLVSFLIIFIFAPHLCSASESLESFFNHDEAAKAVEYLSNESSKFQTFAYKVKFHPKYKKHQKREKFAKDFDLYIRVTGPEINGLGNIDTESLYLAPAYYRLYIGRYFEFQEYKIAKLELELAKKNGKPSSEISILESDLKERETKLKGYLGENDQWPD